jgi:hypothetical protein
MKCDGGVVYECEDNGAEGVCKQRKTGVVKRRGKGRRADEFGEFARASDDETITRCTRLRIEWRRGVRVRRGVVKGVSARKAGGWSCCVKGYGA